MPAAFAHDLYGRRVYRKLDPEMQKLIRKERNCYFLGLHGPDVLFFYKAWGKNPVNQKGCRLHAEPAAVLFAHGLEEFRRANGWEKDAICAYLLGVACHFSLDNALHGYINAKAASTKLSHADIETELDRRLISREHMDPLKTNVTCHLKNTMRTRMAASRVLGEKPNVISKCIVSFKLINRLFVNSGEFTKRMVRSAMRFSGSYGEVQGMIMRRTPVAGCGEITDYLERRFFKEIPEGAELLEEVWKYLWYRGPVPERFSGNFNGESGKEAAA